MDLKKTDAPVTTVTYNRNEIDAPTIIFTKLFLLFQNVQNKLILILEEN